MEQNKQSTKCPSCGHLNLLGSDRCEQCFGSLMQRGLPRPSKNDNFQNVMMTSPISELITGKDLLVCSTDDTVQHLVEVIQKRKKQCVIVYKDKKLTGIISNRDILKKAAGKGQDLSKIKASDVMTPNPEFVNESTPIAYVVNKMAMGGFRHVPVIADDGTPVSIISIQDVLSYLAIQEHGGRRDEYVLPDPQ